MGEGVAVGESMMCIGKIVLCTCSRNSLNIHEKGIDSRIAYQTIFSSLIQKSPYGAVC